MIVATDDERIADAVSAFGGDARMTSAAHQSGTDRLAEVAAVARLRPVVNVQGDEPLIEPAMIDEAVAPFAADAGAEMSTLRRRIDDAADRQNPNVTKVVVDRRRLRAVFFARADPVHARRLPAGAGVAARRPLRLPPRVLLRLAALPPTALERSEALEQLRALEHGIRIKCVETACDSIGVDTPEDLERVRASDVAAPP